MADPMMLADARTARLVKSATTALELVGRSVAIVRTQELIRRAAQVDGGVLLVADRGADVESVARELHDRARRPAHAFIHVACSSGDPARLDSLLFGSTPDTAPPDLEWIAGDSRIAREQGWRVELFELSRHARSDRSHDAANNLREVSQRTTRRARWTTGHSFRQT